MNQMEVAQSLPLSWTCPASSRWQVLGFGKVGDGGVGVAEVDLDGVVPGDRLVGSDGVVLDPVVLGVGCRVKGVWDLFEEHTARTSGTRSRVRVSRSARGCEPGCGRGAARGGW